MQRCPREFKHRFIDGIERIGTVADDKLEFGTRFARILELNAAVPRDAEPWSVGEAVRGCDAELAATLAGTASAYEKYWRGSLSYLGTEVKFTTPLPHVDRIHLTTTLDGLAHDARGDLVVVDQKTTSSDISPGSWWWEKLAITLQPSVYIWAARANGHDVSHAIWDCVKRPTSPRRTEAIEPDYYVKSGKWGKAGDLKPGTGIPAETVPEYAARIRDTMLAEPTKWFQRGDVHRSPGELHDAVTDVEQECRRLLYAWDHDEFPRNTSACWSFGRKCEFFEICSGAAKPTDETLYQIRKDK